MGSDFRRFWAAAALSNLGDGVGSIAVPLLAASLTRDPVLVGGLTAMVYLPWLLLGLPAGVLVDRVDRRAAMVAANVVRAALLGALCAALLADVATVAWLYAVVFLLGCAETVYDSAAHAALPALVGRERLDGANAWMQGALTVTQNFLGAPVGAVLFAVAAALPFGANAAGFVLAALLVASLPRLAATGRRPRSAGLAGVADEVREGVTWLWRHRQLRVLLLVACGTGFALMLAQATVVLLALEELGISESAFGLFAAAGGAGAVVGAVNAPWLARRLGRGPVLVGSQVVVAVALAGTGLSPGPVVFGVAFALSGWGVAAWNVLSMSLRQQIVPERLFGRVQGAFRTLLYGVMPVAAWCGGVVAAAGGLRAPWLAGAAIDVLVLLAGGAALLRVDRSSRPVSRSRGEPAGTAARSAAPPPA